MLRPKHAGSGCGSLQLSGFLTSLMMLQAGVRWDLRLLLAALVCHVGAILAAADTQNWSAFSKNPYAVRDYRDHHCKRPCEPDTPPETCRYYFLLEHYITMSDACYDCPDSADHCALPQCAPADGFSRGILTVNRMVPGPTIDVCLNDTVEVVVDNRMELGEGTSIHWHGLNQQGTPHMDGTAHVTQCPINVWTSMTYRFQALDPGTHFWHAHSAIQRSEGLYGGIVIRQPHSTDPQGHLYDHDLSEHRVILTDWTHQTAGKIFAQDYRAGLEASPDQILVNGIGGKMPKLVFHVQKGQRYRFRISYNGIMSCPIMVSVDEHPLLVIAADGQDLTPVEVDQLMIVSGERYDFVLTTHSHLGKGSGNFWVRFKGLERCHVHELIETSILRYHGAPDEFPEGRPTYNGTEEEGRILNPHEGRTVPTDRLFMDVSALKADHDVALTQGKPDKQLYVTIGPSEMPYERFEPPSLHSTHRPPYVRPINQQLNYISSRMPPAPPLSQFKDIPQDLLCNNETVQVDCSEVLCECVHLVNYSLGQVIEVALLAFHNGAIHPMHLHGHSFTVVSQHLFNRSVTVQEAKEMDARGEIERRHDPQAPKKDTIPVYPLSLTILRFRATNPGFWFFHCHIEFHAEVGMAMILQEGAPTDLPPVPDNFPRCGSWDQTIVPANTDCQNGTSLDGDGRSNGTDDQPSAHLVEVIVFATLTCALVVGILAYALFKNFSFGRKSSVYEHITEDKNQYSSIAM